MAVKLFILGLPGSGKSTISHHISNYIRERQWLATHISEYDILYQMFQQDTYGLFRATAYGGFDVLHLPVLDSGIRRLEKDVNKHLSTSQLEEIVIIEFSRNNYEEAFRIFSQEILKDAYFLHLNVELETCKERVRERASNANVLNNHYVSEYIFDTYYFGDDGIDLPRILEGNYGIDSLKVRVVNNNFSQENSAHLNAQFEEIRRFIDDIIANESPGLQETEPIRKLTDVEVQSELGCN